MKKMSIVLSGILLTSTVLSACGAQNSAADNTSSEGSKGNEPVTLKYYNWDSEVSAAATKKLIENYQAKNPNVKVESVTLVPGNSLETLKKLDVTMSSGEQVDVVLFPSIEETIARSAQGVLAPLDDFYKKDNINPDDEYYINPRYKGKTYAAMSNSSNWLVLFNEDALKAANLPAPTFGWTWDDFRDYAKKLTKGDGAGKQYGTYFHTWGEYTNMIAYTDKKNPYLTAELKPQFDDPSFKQFFEMRKAMEKDDKSAKPLSDVIGGKLSYVSEYLSGKAAMMITGSFMLANIGDTKKYPHEFKTIAAPLPRPSKDSDPGLTNIGGQYAAIAQSSKHKDEAYKFIRYMTTEQEARVETSGWKKADATALVEKLYGANKNLIDLPSVTTTLYDKKVKTSVSSDIAVSYGSQLKKVMEDGMSKFLLDGAPIEEVQKWMMTEGDKIIKQNTK